MDLPTKFHILVDESALITHDVIHIAEILAFWRSDIEESEYRAFEHILTLLASNHGEESDEKRSLRLTDRCNEILEEETELSESITDLLEILLSLGIPVCKTKHLDVSIPSEEGMIKIALALNFPKIYNELGFKPISPSHQTVVETEIRTTLKLCPTLEKLYIAAKEKLPDLSVNAKARFNVCYSSMY